MSIKQKFNESAWKECGVHTVIMEAFGPRTSTTGYNSQVPFIGFHLKLWPKSVPFAFSWIQSDLRVKAILNALELITLGKNWHQIWNDHAKKWFPVVVSSMRVSCVTPMFLSFTSFSKSRPLDTRNEVSQSASRSHREDTMREEVRINLHEVYWLIYGFEITVISS